MACVLVAVSLLSSLLPAAHSVRVLVGRSCHYDEDCGPFSYCKGQKVCECKAGHFLYKEPSGDEKCLPEVSGVGAACTLHVQCSLQMGTAAMCSPESGCQCRPGAHVLHNRCYNTSRVGESCLTSDNCRIEQDVLLSCERSVCVCPRAYHPNGEGSLCILSVALGEACTGDEQCVSAHSKCYQVCECNVQHIMSSNRTACLPARTKVGEPCEEAAQCSKNIDYSTCREGLCSCPDGFHSGEGGHTCWRTAALGEACTYPNECRHPSAPQDTPLADCVGGVCRCPEGNTPAPGGAHCVPGNHGHGQGPPLLSVLLLVAMAFHR